MDDYTSNILNDSKNEWSILLINYITPHIIDGFKSIFNESVNLCEQNDEIEKYLMTFQNLLSRIPKWNQTVVLEEQARIVNSCNCSYTTLGRVWRDCYIVKEKLHPNGCTIRYKKNFTKNSVVEKCAQ